MTNSSGVTLLASKLSAYQRSHCGYGRANESVKLSDSLVYSPHIRSPALSTPAFDTLDSFKEEIERLLAQTVQQEQALVHFHAESVRAQDEYNFLRTKLIIQATNAVKNRLLSGAFFVLRNDHVKQTKNTSKLMVDSVNLTETLKLLALQLESPTAENNSSILHSSSAPFSITRKHIRK